MNKTLYAYTIENDKLSKAHSDFTERFLTKLKNSKAIKQRCYEVNSETKESDLLFKYMEVSKNVVYGIIARIKPTKDMPSLPKDFMDRVSLEIKDLEGLNESGEKMSCSDIDYFVLDHYHLVTTIPSSRIARFKTFANFFLAAERGDSLYSIVSMIDMPKDVKLEDLTQIVFSGNGSAVSLTGGKEVKTTIIQMAKDKLSSLVNDSNIAFLLDKNILTANLVVRFNTRSKIYKNDTEVKKALSAVITNINSDDSVLLATKNKQKITAGSTRRCKIITIDDVSGNLPNEESLRQEMVGYLNELRELII
jgi:hypothetical protein